MMLTWNKKITMTMILSLMLLLGAGCGKDNGADNPGETDNSDIVTVSDSSGISFRVDKLIPISIEDPETHYSSRTIYSGSFGSRLCLLASYQFEDDGRNDSESDLWMYIFDLNTQKTEKTVFSLEVPDRERFDLRSMYVTGENELTLRLYGSVEGEDASTVLCRTDFAGKPLNSDALFSEDNGCLPDPGLSNSKLFPLPNSSPILTEWDGNANAASIYLLDLETGSRTSLVALPNDFVSSLCADAQGNLYYVGNGDLKYLDMESQTSQILSNLHNDNGIELYGSCYLLITDDGELAICTVDDQQPRVYLLTDKEEIIDPDTIRLVRLTATGMGYASRMASTWSRSSDSYRIQTKTENREQELAALYDQTMLEIVNGKGPDLMWVSEDVMRTLADKGVLMDLSELIPEDVKEHLFPGVLQAGTLDGVLVGIAPEVSFYTMLAPDSIWSGDTWTVSELMTLAESRDDWERPLSLEYGDPDAHALFWDILARDLSGSPYLDLEHGISYFNSEQFIRILEFCLKHGREEYVASTNDESFRVLKETKCAGMPLYCYDGLISYSYDMLDCGNSHVVGYPREEGSGSYVFGEGYLVVNKNAAHKEEIKDFIAFLLDYENQYTVDMSPVRRDVVRDCIEVNMMGETCVKKRYTGNHHVILPTKPDGTTYLEDFMAFAESCEPRPYCPEAIKSILREELGACWSGDKSPEETADVIHRRVQLYFDEH